MSTNAICSRFRDILSIVAIPVFLAIGMSDAAAAPPQGPAIGQPNDNTPKPGIFLSGSMRSGRIVDIWALDENNTPAPITKKQGQSTISDPLYLDTVVGEAIGISKTSTSSLTPPVSLVLQRDPISGSTALVIGTQFSKSPKSPFQIALKEATVALGTIAMGGPTSLGPFSQVPRDAAIVLNFDRPVNPNTIGPETIQVFVGSSTTQGNLPPTPFTGRYIWKAEQPKTVVIDTTINAVDDARIEDAIENNNLNPKKFPKQNPQVLPINTLGLPASLTSTTFNVAIFMPSKYNIIAGVTKIILGRDGTALDINKSNTKYIYHPSGQQSSDGITGVARVFRAGNGNDANQGFLTDPSSPSILGTQQIVVTAVENVAPNDGRLITFNYINELCSLSVRVGDSFQQGSAFATVASVDPSSLSDGDPGFKVTVNYLQSTKFNTTDPALITTPFTELLAVKAGCFVLMQPTPDTVTIPLTGVDPQVIFTVRFSKPMQLSKVDPLRTIAILLNPAHTQPLEAKNFELAVANIIPSPDLRSFRYVPFIPLPHTNLAAESYKLVLVSGANGLTDLAGNPLTIGTTAFTVPFAIKASAPSNKSRNFHMKFDSLFEVQPATQVSGQVSKSSLTTISGRPVTHFSRDLDQSNTMVNAMAIFAQAIQTPLSALGSRLQTVYRHVDCNLSLNQLSDIDLDIEGLYWAPFAGQLNVSDFFEHIRIDLSHSKFAPDEFINAANNLPAWTQSGLSTQSFANNVFELADHPPGIVYEGVYNVSPNALFATSSGTNVMPWPKFTNTYTWRDSTYGSLKFGATGGNGVNPDQYFSLLNITPTPAAGSHPDKPYAQAKVPSVGLPLLMDFRIYPADDPNTKGLNGFLVAVAVTSSSLPSFRVFSTGGLDTNQSPKTVVPDVATPGTIPSGGYFPPGSTQGVPGTKTSAQGPEVYVGRVDFAVKNSHAYTHFYNFTNATVTTPVFQNTNTIVLPTTQPANTSIIVGYRGATTASILGATNDARCFDAYGDQYVVAPPAIAPTIPQPIVSGCGTAPTGIVPVTSTASPSSINFTTDITQINGKVFVQMRFTFISDIVNNVGPSMNGFGIAYSGL
ncbi:MAG: hypothetical protein ACKVS6_14605 [Planctomycetota bacterium]